MVTINSNPSDTIMIQPLLNIRFPDYQEHIISGRGKITQNPVSSYHGDARPIKVEL